jgi:exodeoxyribonuclease V alpha subunit
VRAVVTVEGTVEEIIFTNEANGYTVCDISYEDKSVTAVGYMPFINVGETLKLTGKWATHPDYGEQLKVELYEKVLPQTIDAIEKYLASGIVKGIGPSTANKIVKMFGEDTLDIIHFNPGKLSEIKGISLDKAIRIGQAFEEQKDLREVVMFFQKFGISPAYSAKIYKVFGEKTIEEIKANPFKLADEVFGIGFKTADMIAKSMGIDPSSKYRICSGIKYVLAQAAANGNTFVPDSKLKEYTAQLLEVEIEGINDALVTLMLDNSIKTEKGQDENKVYLSTFHNAEVSVCKKLIELSSIDFSDDLESFERDIEEVQSE